MKSKRKTNRPYRRITARTIAKHQVNQLVIGNGTRTVELTDPDYLTPHDRAYRIQKKSETMPTSQYLNESMDMIATEAIQELGELIHSPNEAIKTRNVHYAIDQTRGKAVTKSIALTGKMNIQSVLD